MKYFGEAGLLMMAASTSMLLPFPMPSEGIQKRRQSSLVKVLTNGLPFLSVNVSCSVLPSALWAVMKAGEPFIDLIT